MRDFNISGEMKAVTIFDQNILYYYQYLQFQEKKYFSTQTKRAEMSLKLLIRSYTLNDTLNTHA